MIIKSHGINSIHIFILLMGIGSLTGAQQCNWSSLGINDSTQAPYGPVGSIKMIVGKNNAPWMAYEDNNVNYEAAVMAYNGNANFSFIGKEGFTPSSASIPAIAADTAYVPYIAFMDNYYNNYISVMKYNGSAWAYVGAPGFSPANVGSLDITVDKGTNIPYVIYQDQGNNLKACVMEYNGTSWVYVGSPDFSAGAVVGVSIKTDITGNLYVAYIDNATGEKIVVQKYNGSNWVPLDTIGGNYANFSFILDKKGTPCVATQNNVNNKATVLHYSGAGWDTIGVSDFSAGSISSPCLTVDTSGNYYLAYADGLNNNEVTVVYFNGTSWVPEGNSDFTNTGAENVNLVCDHKNNLYVCCNTSVTGYYVQLVELKGGTWTTLDNQHNTNASSYLNLAINKKNNVPYIVYQDQGNSNKASVMQYNGSSWVNVGPPGFTSGAVNYTTIAIDTGGIPYIAFSDNANSQKATVMKYNGSSWVTVGNAGFSAGAAGSVSLAISPANVVYAGYADGNHSSKASVMKFNGASWVYVGSAGFSFGNINYTSLAISGAGTPYIAYQDVAQSNSGVTVMEFNGSSWVNVGNPGFSYSAAYYTSLAIDPTGIPYVAYQDNGAGFSVMKYMGSSWFYVGGKRGVTSPGDASDISLVLNAYGNPLVSFSDYANNKKLSVMTFNSASWSYSITAGLSATSISSSSIALDGNGTPYVAYITSSSWVRKLTCPPFDTLSGKAFTDNNHTCVYGLGDGPAPKVKMNALYDNNIVATVLTDNSGNYIFPYMIKGGQYVIEMDRSATPWYFPSCQFQIKDTVVMNTSMVLNIPLKDTLKTLPQMWGPVDGGMPNTLGYVWALAKYDSLLYAGGYFINAGNVKANGVAQWNGKYWKATQYSSGMNDDVYSLAIYNRELYAGGYFTQSDGITTNRIARWNGTSWTAVGSGISGGAQAVEALAVYNGKLYLGGNFLSPYSNIATWNGSAIGTVGALTVGSWGVDALCVYHGKLYAGGAISNAAGLPVRNIATWDGTIWDTVGKGANNVINSLCIYQNRLYAGGSFDSAGGNPASNIAYWNDTAWFPVSSGTNGTVYGLAVYNGELYASGTFTIAGGKTVSNIAVWDGHTWAPAGSGTNGYTADMAVYDSVLYAGGEFTVSGNDTTYHIAQYPTPDIIFAGKVFKDSLKNCTYTRPQDTELDSMAVLVIDNLRDTLKLLTDTGGNFSDTLPIELSYKVKLEIPKNLNLYVNCPFSGFYSDSASFSYNFNFALIDSTNVVSAVKQAAENPETVKLYPNPNDSRFTIQIPVDIRQSIIEIYNAYGEVVYKSTTTQSTIPITIPFAEQGIYLYRVINEKGIVTGEGKFVVEN